LSPLRSSTSAVSVMMRHSDGRSRVAAFHEWQQQQGRRNNYELHMIPCRHFVAGTCPRGSRCRYYHPHSSSGVRDVLGHIPDLPDSFRLIPAQLRMHNDVEGLYGNGESVISSRTVLIPVVYA